MACKSFGAFPPQLLFFVIYLFFGSLCPAVPTVLRKLPWKALLPMDGKKHVLDVPAAC